MQEPSRKERERLVREQAIVDAAERVFCERGFEEASMDEIAAASEFTKRTVYQYFSGKEDLYFAVVLKGFRLIDTFMREYMEEARTGYDKLEALMIGLYRFYRANPEIFLLVSRWSYVKRKFALATPERSRLEVFNVDLFRRIESVFSEGLADGTIESNLSPVESACSVVYLVMGFMTNLALTGESFAKFQNLELERFSLNTINLILAPFRGKGAAHS